MNACNQVLFEPQASLRRLKDLEHVLFTCVLCHTRNTILYYHLPPPSNSS